MGQAGARGRAVSLRYSIYGALIGCGLPVLATLMDARGRGLALSAGGLLEAQATQPLLWIVDSAPFFLGLIALLAGGYQDRLTRQREEHFRSLIEDVSDVLAVLSGAHCFEYVSPSVERVLGWRPAELAGTDAFELVHVEDLARTAEAFSNAVQHPNGPWTVEHRLRRKDGSWCCLESRGKVLRHPDRALKVVVTSRDVTARQRAEELLRESEERYRSLFEVNPSPLWVFDEETLGFLAVNQAAIEQYGYSRDEFLGMTLRDIRPPEDVPALLGHLSSDRPRLNRAGAWRHRRKDGTIIDVDITSNAVLLGGRRARLVRAEDVTQRRLAEEERARLAMAVEQADEAIVITDPQGTILYVNPACERISGYTRAEAVGQNPRALKSGKHDAAFYDELWGTLLRGEVWRGHFVNKGKSGALFEVDATISPVRDSVGKLVNYVAVERDVTHERRLEEKFLQAQKMEAVGRLAGGVAHDFNNLLNVITGYGELLLRHAPAEDPARAKLEQILRASDRAASLTRQLLAFSRKQVLQPKVVDLNLLVADLEKMLRRLIGEDVDLATRPAPDLGTVKVDPGQIEQVIMNLAVNARDAMPRGGKLTIETRNVDLDQGYVLDHPVVHTGAYVMLAVSDTGHGMDSETQSHLFEPFFTTKEQGKGTGLGLSTVYGIVKQSGGYIWFYSELGRGTTFKVYFPRMDRAAHSRGSSARPRPPAGSETILLVEDEGMLRDLLHEALEAQGYKVLAAQDGEEAVRIAQACHGPVQLMVTDVVMPGMSGNEVAARVARGHPETRVLYVSGYTDDSIVRHGVLDPGVAFLAKPFTPDDLLDKVRAVLDSPPG